MHAKVRMFLHERDRALARGDGSVVRSMDAELRRLGVSDEATEANPTGRHLRAVRTPGEGNAGVLATKPKTAKLPRCEHDQVSERCSLCNPELTAK